MAIANLASFTASLTSALNVRDEINKVVRTTSLQVLSGVVMGTRVKIGRARGNWQVTHGSSSEIEDTGRLDKNGGPTIALGNAVISKAQAGVTVWIVNNLPYIQMLEGLDHMADNTATRVQAQFK